MTIRKKIILFIAALILAISLICFGSTTKSNTLSNNSNSYFVKTNGIRIHYIDKGKGPLVILLHGWPETSLAWRNTINVLSTHYRVVAPDLRGIGLSERTPAGYDKKTIATDIKSLIEALGEKQAVIIGHDMGGKAAYIMAHLYPQYVSKLVLVDCLIPGIENTDIYHGGAWHYGFHMTPEIPEMLTKGHEEEYITAQIKAWSFKKEAISQNVIHEYAKYYTTKGGMTAGFNYYRTLKEDAALANIFSNQKLSMPVLAISGSHGVGDKLSNALKTQTTSLETIIVEDSGHFVAEENPELFNAAVLKFLDNTRENTNQSNVIAIVKKAENYTKKYGIGQAIIKFNKSSNIFMGNYNGRFYVSPLHPELIGNNQLNYKDSSGILVVQEEIEKAKTGGGWLNGRWRKNPQTGKYQCRKIYVLPIPDNYFVGSWYYSSNKAGACLT